MKMKKQAKGGNAILIVVFLIATFFIITLNMMAFDNAVDVVKHNTRNTVLVDAVVTEVNERYDNDTGYHWNVLVSYTYNGVEYSNVFYDTCSSEQAVGSTVLVKINPELPNEIVPDQDQATFSAVSTVIILTIIIFVLYIALLIPTSVVTDKLRCKSEIIPRLISILILVVKQAVESLFFYKQYNSFVYAKLSAIPIIVLIIIVLILNLRSEKEASAKS